MAKRCRTKKGKFTACRRGMSSLSGYGRAKKRRTRRARPWGQALQIYNGYGEVPISVESVVPPAVGGFAALATTLILRGVVKPVATEKAADGTVTVQTEGGYAKANWPFKYSGLIGAGVGLVGSGVLGFIMGWGAGLSSGIAALTTGLTTQFANMVVGKDYIQYLGQRTDKGAGYGGVVLAMPRPQFKGFGQPTRSFMQQGNPRAFSGRGMGAIGIVESGRYLKPGRGQSQMPAIPGMNAGAFGPQVPGMGM